MASRHKVADVVSRILLGLIGTFVALIPTWLYLGARFVFSPNGFFQEVFLFGVGLWFLGGLQFIFLIALVVWLVTVCSR